MHLKKPKAFISYAWEDDVKIWVKSFVDRLIEDNIDVYVDLYDLYLGDRLPKFMEEKIIESDYVLIICTPKYKNKADLRVGGVGYEGHIISGELLNKSNERKFIPILRKGKFGEALPNFLAGKNSANLSEDNQNYEIEYQTLVSHIRGEKLKPTSKKKNNVNSKKKSNSTVNEDITPIRILNIITDEITTPKMDGTRGSALYKIPFQLSRKPSKLWSKLFVQVWDSPPRFTSMHRPGIASVVGDKIVLDGTTIDEVRQYHKDTLDLCIAETNKKAKESAEKIQKQEILEQQKRDEHFKNVTKIANEILF